MKAPLIHFPSSHSTKSFRKFRSLRGSLALVDKMKFEVQGNIGFSRGGQRLDEKKCSVLIFQPTELDLGAFILDARLHYLKYKLNLLWMEFPEVPNVRVENSTSTFRQIKEQMSSYEQPLHHQMLLWDEGGEGFLKL